MKLELIGAAMTTWNIVKKQQTKPEDSNSFYYYCSIALKAQWSQGQNTFSVHSKKTKSLQNVESKQRKNEHENVSS